MTHSVICNKSYQRVTYCEKLLFLWAMKIKIENGKFFFTTQAIRLVYTNNNNPCRYVSLIKSTLLIYVWGNILSANIKITGICVVLICVSRFNDIDTEVRKICVLSCQNFIVNHPELIPDIIGEKFSLSDISIRQQRPCWKSAFMLFRCLWWNLQRDTNY